MRYVSHSFFCTNCGQKGIPIARSVGKLREPGHLKKLYCIYCKAEHNFAEIGPGYSEEDFRREFEAGNFKEGKRVLTFRQVRAQVGLDE